MTRVTVVQRLAAAAIAVLVTTSTVWGMANLGHPTSNAALLLARSDCSGS